ncbi:hypothetical protein Pst134EA_023028 [Puccinia striiformis f. sp. tritici]|uniref:hypothetical protein n=1 Tax=Puccinia striiformis f. sp. tritici TaxID=168172 RepID=UPI0020077406|nr:hypothetical protein Pst134EA_023028 [Puccinia striiformis f. sp. tritici]KAH9455569.1 hypothetical protein Pst134EA_023028 [Puccinia striiformis f. sp. tritici]
MSSPVKIPDQNLNLDTPPPISNQITLEPTLNKESIVLLGPNLFARLEPQTNLSTRHNDSIDLPNLLRTKITFSYPGKNIARFQLKQENKLEYQIFLNRFLREYQAHKKHIKKKAIAALLTKIQANPNHVNFLYYRPDAYQQKAEWLFSKRKKNRKKGTEEEDQYLAFVQLYGDDKEVLAKACKIVNSPAPETDLGTVTPKGQEKTPAKSRISGPTGNILLNAHVAKKKVDKLKKIVPLDISDTSTIESANSLFTTKPFKLTNLFPESLEEKPLAALNSTPKVVATPIHAQIVTTKKDTSKSKLPVIDDSEDKLELAMDTSKSSNQSVNNNKTNVPTRSNRPTLHPRLDDPEPRGKKAGRKTDQPTCKGLHKPFTVPSEEDSRTERVDSGETFLESKFILLAQ